MLCPNGIRWIQTLRKLPIMEPNTKNTRDQKWKGTAAQIRASNVVESMRRQNPKAEDRNPKEVRRPKSEYRMWLW